MKHFSIISYLLLLSQLCSCRFGDKTYYPIVLINGWGGSSLDGTSTNETKNYVTSKCDTEFTDMRIWISLSTALDFVFKN